MRKIRVVTIMLVAMVISFAGGAADLKQILRGTDTISSGDSIQTVTINLIDTAKSFLIFSMRVNSTAPSDFMVAGEITNDTTLTFYRYNNGNLVVIEWQVFEFDSGVYVQHGSTVTDDSTDVTILSVDLTRSFVICTMSKSGPNYNANDGATAELINSTILRLQGGGGTYSAAYWQVIEYDSCIVQRMIKRLANGSSSDTVIIDSVNTGKTMVVGNHRQNGTVSSKDLARTELINDTAIAFTREGSANNLDFVVYVVEFTDQTVVKHGLASFSGGITRISDTISAVDFPCSGIIAPGNFGRQGSTSSANTNIGQAWFTFKISSFDSVDVQRASGGGASAKAPFQVVTFSGCPDSLTPSILIVDAGADVEICSGDSIAIGGAQTAFGGTPPYTYSWIPAASLNYDTIPNPIATPANITAYIVTVTDSLGAQGVDTVIITINPLPVISVTPNPGVFCVSDSVMLIASGASTYIWSPDIGLSSTTGDSVWASPPTDTIYTVYGMSAFGCKDSAIAKVLISDSVAVASFNADSANICQGDTVTFNNTSTDATGFSWSFPEGTPDTSTIRNPVIIYDSAGTFDVTLTAFGCFVDSTITKGGYILVKSLPTVPITSDETACEGNPIPNLTATGSVVKWYSDPELDSLVKEGATFPTGHATVGIYTYYVTQTSSGCESLADTVTLTITATCSETCSDEIRNQDETGVDCGGVCDPCPVLNIPSVFTPNGDGANETWVIRGKELYPEILIEVYNRWGSLIFSSPTGYPVEWDGKDVPDGVYYYIITLGNGALCLGNKSCTGTVTIVR